tara:strand:+ start:476 stop:673 length:198 start_codon:yes stop_codon:yes gene_type:complete
MIKLNALFKSFGSKKVLRGINLEVESGEIVTLVGNNGSGKTTLLRTLTTLIVLTNTILQRLMDLT